MKYEVIFEKGDYALILRGSRMNEYAVVYGLNKEEGCWSSTCGYCGFGDYWNASREEALFLTVDLFRCKTEENYISYSRMSEIATKLKDGLLEDDEESAMEYFENEVEMTGYEMEYFGIKERECENLC